MSRATSSTLAPQTASASSASIPDSRFVRLENSTFSAEVVRDNSNVLLTTNAHLNLARAQHLVNVNTGKNLPKAAENAQRNVSRAQHSLAVAVGGASIERDTLMQQHMVSSAHSPFLSGTPAFTTGQNSQLSYMMSNLTLKPPLTQIATIHRTPRALSNKFNTRENELLLPHGEMRNERIGMLHVEPIGTAPNTRLRTILIDKTVAPPKLYTGASAVTRFKQLSQDE